MGLSLPRAVQDFVTLTLSIMVEATPFVILGALVSAAIRIYVPAQRIVAFLPRRPAFRRLWISFLGMFMPVCECGNMPVARGLIFKGLSISDSTTFLLAAPIINPVTLFSTSQAFRLDPSIVWLRLAGGLIIANLVGALISLHKNPISLASKSFQEALQASDAHGGHHHGHDHHHGPKWQEGIGIFRDEVSLMLKVLCLGAVIAGLTQVFVPRGRADFPRSASSLFDTRYVDAGFCHLDLLERGRLFRPGLRWHFHHRFDSRLSSLRPDGGHKNARHDADDLQYTNARRTHRHSRAL